MKRQLWVGALALASAGGAAAQSGVIIYGMADAAVGRPAGSAHTQLLDSAGSRLGFGGREDLGGGLTASFQIEHRFRTDTGATADATKFWRGGSIVSLGSTTLGKVSLGRWWTQAFLKSEYPSDPFAMQTVGLSYGTVGCGPTGCVGTFWVDNSITYEYSLAGFSAGVQTATREAGTTKRPLSVGLSYTLGGLYLGYGYEDPGNVNDVWQHATVNYDFKVVKLFSGFGSGRNYLDQRVRNMLVGASVPVVEGGSVVGSYNQHRLVDTTVSSKASLGYQQYLSRRTKVYATATRDSKLLTDKAGFDVGLQHTW